MKQAIFYEKSNNKHIQCKLCPHNCKIANNQFGICNVRKNIDGKLYTLSYNKPIAIHLDPIEKKPLFHFLPGTYTFSVGMASCNLKCQHCQNFEISQKGPEEIPSKEMNSEKIVKLAKESKCPSLSYTYTEPLISYEYVLEIAKISKKNKIKNVIVSNGFINKEPLTKLCKYLDAANIDIKSFNTEFYKKYCSATLEPVLESLKILKRKKVWLEVTTLIIPGLNDSTEEINRMCKWIKENLGEIPLHLSRFFPHYKMLDKMPTPTENLEKVKKEAEKHLNHVYIGNIQNKENESTYCPKCKKLLIERDSHQKPKNTLKGGKCSCGQKIPGIWN